MSLFEELKRRNVIRIAAAYIVAAWLLIQVAETIFPLFGYGDQPARIVVIVLSILFIPALVLAWAFELTPDGFQRDHEVERSRSITPETGKRLDRVIMAVLAVALIFFAFDKFVLDPQRKVDIAESASEAGAERAMEEARLGMFNGKSIAVLPFVNMSADSDNEYFSDGLSEELLNLLTKIPELRVAARTSSFSYKARDVNITQIGEELNVTHVLQGSVRKSGNDVRITAQLVKVDNGFQLWSETFNRTLNDIFVVQDEIAKSVVDKLRINLLGNMPKVRKTDPEVYSLYLQAGYFIGRQGVENLEKAAALLNEALAIDPDYAPAWVRLDFAYESLSIAKPAVWEELKALRIEAIERALAIDENDGYTWVALAYQKTFYDSDWHGARIAVEKALRLDPNDADVIAAAAWLANATGRLLEAIELYEKAVSLDPLNHWNLIELGSHYLRVGRIDDTFVAYDRARAIYPDNPNLSRFLGRAYMMRGDLENALFETEKNPEVFFYRHQKAVILSMMGRETEAQTLINELLETSADDAAGAMAVVYAWRGDGDSAFEWLERAHEQGNDIPGTFLGNLFWRKLTGDPRYSAYVEKIGLLGEWQAMPPEYGGPPAQ